MARKSSTLETPAETRRTAQPTTGRRTARASVPTEAAIVRRLQELEMEIADLRAARDEALALMEKMRVAEWEKQPCAGAKTQRSRNTGNPG